MQATGFGKIKLIIQPWPCRDERSAKASANRVNNNFIDTIDNLTRKLNINCNSVSVKTYLDCFKFNLVTTSDVRRIIDSMKNTPTVDSDFDSLQMLRKSPVSVIKALTVIFIASMTNGVFPIAWKHSIVTPVLKKGDVYNPGNCRPLSHLPIISKIMKHLINKQLRAFLDSLSVIIAAHHGFRHGYSYETALMSISQHLFH